MFSFGDPLQPPSAEGVIVMTLLARVNDLLLMFTFFNSMLKLLNALSRTDDHVARSNRWPATFQSRSLRSFSRSVLQMRAWWWVSATLQSH
jgi:hypothetical protein